MSKLLMCAFLLFYIAITMFIIIAIQEVAKVRIEGPFWGRIAHQVFVMMTGVGFVWIWQWFEQLKKPENPDLGKMRQALHELIWEKAHESDREPRRKYPFLPREQFEEELHAILDV